MTYERIGSPQQEPSYRHCLLPPTARVSDCQPGKGACDTTSRAANEGCSYRNNDGILCNCVHDGNFLTHSGRIFVPPIDTVGAHNQRSRSLTELDFRSVTQKEAALRKLQTTIETAGGASDRRTALLERRRTEYRASFATLLDEEATLQTLYAPLAEQIEAAGNALAKLQFVVGRHVNIAQWADEGENLLDLRKTSTFRGEGALLQIATERLAKVWATGTAEAASTAIQTFFTDYRPELLKAMPPNIDRANRRAWEQQLITWLYNTSHIEVHYSVQYNNTPIEKLSPGTRGIVLLLLYLVLD
jgi:hypothetical protein